MNFRKESYLIIYIAQDIMTMSAKGFLTLITILATILTVLTLAPVATTTSLSNSAFVQGKEKFVADLSVSEVYHQ